MHGAVLFLAVGLYLGALRGRPARGAVAGVAIGLSAAAGYYALAGLLGHLAMFPLWMAVWAGFALLDARGLRSPPAAPAGALVRGLLAAVGSGVAFFAISGIWTDPPPGGPAYGRHFLSWTAAFLPGFLALLAGKRER